MKNLKLFFLSICLIMLMLTSSCFAATDKILFDSENYVLKYSKVAPSITMNEYYLSNEKGYEWTKLITVLKIKQFDNPAFYAMNLARSLPMSDITTVENDKIYIVTFVASKKQNDGTYYIEPNILKVEKCKESGIRTIQFAQKFICKNEEDVKILLTNYLKNDIPKYTKLIVKEKIPKILEKDFQVW